MAELNEVFIFSKDLHKILPIEEGKNSIYGVRPSNIFNENYKSAGDPNNSKIFKRDSCMSAMSKNFPGGNSLQNFADGHHLRGNEKLTKSNTQGNLNSESTHDGQSGGLSFQKMFENTK